MDNSNTARNSQLMDMVLLRLSNMAAILSKATRRRGTHHRGTHHKVMRLKDTLLVLDTEGATSSLRRRVEGLVPWVARHWVLVVD
jgi:archaeosine-15-forming tRNA-guanine transglycosylase